MTEIMHGSVTLRAVPAWDDYWAGDDGHIYSTKRGEPTRLKEIPHKQNGRPRVSLYREDRRYERTLPNGRVIASMAPRQTQIHTLIAACWLPPRPSPAHEIDHRNENPWDNRPDNLRWVTKTQNVYAYLGNHPDAQKGSNNTSAKLTEADIPAIRALQGVRTGDQVGEWWGVSGTAIRDIWRGRTWAHVP